MISLGYYGAMAFLGRELYKQYDKTASWRFFYVYVCVCVNYAIYVIVAAEGIRFSRTLAIGSVEAQCG